MTKDGFFGKSRKDLQKEIDQLNYIKEVNDSVILRVTDESASFERQLIQSQSRESALNKRVETLTAKLSELTARETELSDREARLSAAQEELDRSRGLDGAISDLRHELDAVRDLRSAPPGFAELESLRVDNIRLSKALSDAISQVSLLEAELRESQSREKALASQIISLPPPAESPTPDVSRLFAEFEELAKSVSAVRRTLESAPPPGDAFIQNAVLAENRVIKTIHFRLTVLKEMEDEITRRDQGLAQKMVACGLKKLLDSRERERERADEGSLQEIERTVNELRSTAERIAGTLTNEVMLLQSKLESAQAANRSLAAMRSTVEEIQSGNRMLGQLIRGSWKQLVQLRERLMVRNRISIEHPLLTFFEQLAKAGNVE